MFTTYCTQLVCICTCIPDSVHKLIVAVEVTTVLCDLIVGDMWHCREVHSEVLDRQVSSSIVNQAQVLEATSNVTRINCVVARTGGLEPEYFIETSICCSIATLSRDP